MNLKECVVLMMKSCRMTQARLAASVNVSQTTIANALARGNVEVKTLLKWCEECDYEIVIQPKNVRGKRPDGQFVITEAVYTAPTRHRQKKDNGIEKGGASE